MIVFFSNFLNHHQVLLSDELYRITNRSYLFVAICAMPESFKKTGYPDFSDRPYLLKAYESEDKMHKAHELAISADVALFGATSLQFEVERARVGKLSFEVGERWLKRGWINLFSPNLIKNQWYYHTLFYNKPFYKLCASAYAASDAKRLHSFKDRCFKWGYFTKVDEFDVESALEKKTTEEISIMWCARFINLKHPELAVKLARKLKDYGYHCKIDMFGGGPEQEKTRILIESLNVNDMVTIVGNKPNTEIIQEMRKHDIFIFTSDRNEGWGAVLNEAMSNGCTVVASEFVGAVPFLVENGKNGMIYQRKDQNSLFEKVKYLLEKPEERKQMAVCAYHTMKEIWSPQNAAHNLLHLIDDLQHGHDTTITDGPCSKANVL